MVTAHDKEQVSDAGSRPSRGMITVHGKEQVVIVENLHLHMRVRSVGRNARRPLFLSIILRHVIWGTTFSPAVMPH